MFSSNTRYETEIKLKASSDTHQNVIEDASTISTNTAQVDEIANTVNTVRRESAVHMADFIRLRETVLQLPELTRESLPPEPVKPPEPKIKVKSRASGVVRTMVTE